jgi:hypothetical protein
MFVFLIRIAVLELKSTEASSFDTFESFFWAASLVAGMIELYAVIYRFSGLIDDTTPVTSPSDFLYFSIVTWTTLGYGDLKPTQLSRMFAASEALLGYIAMGLYLSLVFNAIGRSPWEDEYEGMGYHNPKVALMDYLRKVYQSELPKRWARVTKAKAALQGVLVVPPSA